MFYRIYQFWSALNPKITLEEENFVSEYLTSVEIIIYNKLSKADRKHATKVAYNLFNTFPLDFNLIKAGLLHDIGKTLRPLSVIEKTFAVLLSIFFPKIVKRLSAKKTSFLHIYLQHAEIGFDIAKSLCLDNDILFLIKNHHKSDLQDKRLRALISADNSN